MSASFTWKCVEEDIESAFWEAAKIRESIGEAYENLYYTPAPWQQSRLMWKNEVGKEGLTRAMAAMAVTPSH